MGKFLFPLILSLLATFSSAASASTLVSNFVYTGRITGYYLQGTPIFDDGKPKIYGNVAGVVQFGRDEFGTEVCSAGARNDRGAIGGGGSIFSYLGPQFFGSFTCIVDFPRALQDPVYFSISDNKLTSLTIRSADFIEGTVRNYNISIYRSTFSATNTITRLDVPLVAAPVPASGTLIFGALLGLCYIRRKRYAHR